MSTIADLEAIADLLSKGLHRLAVETVGRPNFPMGRWSYRDGRQILFDYHYQPLCLRRRNGLIEAGVIRPDDGWMQQEIFFMDDRKPFYQQYEGMKHLRRVLVEWRMIRRTKEERRAAWKEFRTREEERR
jgi:hypothetical protein